MDETKETKFNSIKARAKRVAKTVGKDAIWVGTLAVAAIGIGVVTSAITARLDPGYAAYKDTLLDAELEELDAIEAADDQES